MVLRNSVTFPIRKKPCCSYTCAFEACSLCFFGRSAWLLSLSALGVYFKLVKPDLRGAPCCKGRQLLQRLSVLCFLHLPGDELLFFPKLVPCLCNVFFQSGFCGHKTKQWNKTIILVRWPKCASYQGALWPFQDPVGQFVRVCTDPTYSLSERSTSFMGTANKPHPKWITESRHDPSFK